MKLVKNYVTMMAKTFALTLLTVAVFTSCKKDKDVSADQPSSIEGKWTGMRGDGNETPDYDFRFTIKKGGSIDATNANGAVKGSGSWTLNGTEFIAQYQFVAPLLTKYMIKGTYDKTSGKLTGVWGFDDGFYDEGTWYLNKQL